MENKTTLFISSGLSGGIATDLVINTSNILDSLYEVLSIQFANDPGHQDVTLKNYSEINLEDIYSAFDKAISNNNPKIYIGHSFSALLLMYYLQDRPSLLKNTEKILLLDPSDAEDLYGYLISNTDGFTLEKSIVDHMQSTKNSELISQIKGMGVKIIQIEADSYDLDHDFREFDKLVRIYQDTELIK